jgi:signal transduction histidine kinase
MPSPRSEALQIIAHEVRGVLWPLAAWGRRLSGGDIRPDETRQAGEVIERGVEVLSRLASDLAALDSAADGEQPLALTVLDLRDVVATGIRVIGYEATLKGVAIVTDVTAEPVAVLGDPVRLAQVVSNLLDNALKFTDTSGKIVVELTAEGGRAQLSVTDTGVGISPGFLPCVFDKFTRQRPEDVERSGWGLGLYLVKRFVEMHGGRVGAESPGRGLGSRFVVTLPLTVAEAA